jgi:hypothetical protein
LALLVCEPVAVAPFPDSSFAQSSSDDDGFAEQDPQLVEAAAHLGDEAGAPEHNSEQLSDAEGGAGIGKIQVGPMWDCVMLTERKCRVTHGCRA